MYQIYGGASLNPNEGNKIIPADPQRVAFYFNDPDFSVCWGWSVQEQEWVPANFTTANGKQMYGGNGAPSEPPNNPGAEALYVDRVTKIVYEWNPATQGWV